jgi:hypothetical protein
LSVISALPIVAALPIVEALPTSSKHCPSSGIAPPDRQSSARSSKSVPVASYLRAVVANVTRVESVVPTYCTTPSSSLALSLLLLLMMMLKSASFGKNKKSKLHGIRLPRRFEYRVQTQMVQRWRPG